MAWTRVERAVSADGATERVWHAMQMPTTGYQAFPVMYLSDYELMPSKGYQAFPAIYLSDYRLMSFECYQALLQPHLHKYRLIPTVGYQALLKILLPLYTVLAKSPVRGRRGMKHSLKACLESNEQFLLAELSTELRWLVLSIYIVRKKKLGITNG
ncbi:hypothetical protein B0H19DRAFT_1232071 [Mycena capillaripes]|nr:hypothetical protein B0H19DRAFT_1232071 [Mycena capillaripes]